MSDLENVPEIDKDVSSHDERCLEALRELYTFVDGELTEERRIEVRGHLDECGGCVGAFDFEVELRQVVSRCCRETEVPDDLRRRIAAAIDSLSEGDAQASEAI